MLASFVVLLFLFAKIKTEKHILVDKSVSESSTCQSVTSLFLLQSQGSRFSLSP